MVRIERVLAPNPDVYTLDGTNTWIVGGDPTIVIDPGPEIASHLREVARAARTVAAVLVTHDHPDHAPGASTFAKLVGAPLLAARLDGARPLRDGQVVRAGEVALTVIATPGHTADHLAFWEPSERALFTGDTVVGKGTSFIDSPGGDLAQYLRSLRRLQELGPRTIYPGHGPVVLDAPGKLDEYIAHRAEREQQILAALADGPATIETLVATIYDGYPVEVRPLAASSVLAHLRKLEAEGRAARKGAAEGADWQRIEPRTCERCGRRPAIGRSKLCGPCSLAVLQDTPE